MPTFILVKLVSCIGMVELSLNFNSPNGSMILSASAAKRINELIEAEGRDGQALQIKVIPGGCAGFSYQFGWTKSEVSSTLVEKDGAKLFIEEADMRLLAGATLDYIISLEGSKFEINNPNASSSCGCGKSFS